MSGRTIELHIDSLVLHGFGQVDREALVRALQEELSALLAAGDVPAPEWRDAELVAVRAPEIRLQSSTAGDGLGRRLAGALHDAVIPNAPRAGEVQR